MAKLVQLEIKNYRGIENLLLKFDHTSNLICFIGRGDSGKTTILEAISAVLSPAWNLAFHDTDFYNCDHLKSIEILATLIDLPPKLITVSKFGLHLRAYDTTNKVIIEDVTIEDSPTSHLECLTLRLCVDQHLEPRWTITNARDQEDKLISGSERAMLNCYMIADHVDKHFSWNKGNPLYSLLKSLDTTDAPDEVNIIIQSLRAAKTQIDQHNFSELQEVTDKITLQAAALGLNILNTNTTLDFKELSIKDGRISLHEDLIPFRLKGKGSKRLISLAIQLNLVKEGGIMIVDEIEQGLEPDRVKHLARALKENSGGQIFLTTHSRDVITELGASPLRLILKDKEASKIEGRALVYNEDTLTKVIRACPDAFFAKKIIVCEGATEIGLCRALDKYRKSIGKQQMSFKDCAYVDGAGDTFVERAFTIVRADIATAILCDSDKDIINNQKPLLKAENVFICDCEPKNCTEAQVFKDLPWLAIQELVQKFSKNIESGFPKLLERILEEKDTIALRSELTAASLSKKWFKRIDYGEAMGDVIFQYFDQMNDEKHLKNSLVSLSTWIDN